MSTEPCPDARAVEIDRAYAEPAPLEPAPPSLAWIIFGAFAMLFLGGCDGAPSRNILGSYFPSWMVCAVVGLMIAVLARVVFRATGVLEELPFPPLVLLAIGCAATFAAWLIWLA